MSHVIAFLQKIPLFNHFSAEALADLAGYLKADRIFKGNPLVQDRQATGRMIIVLQGQVGIYRRTLRGPGYESGGPATVIGLLDLLGNISTSVTVRAEEDTVILTLSRKDFLSFLRDHAEEHASLLKYLSHRLYQAGITLDVTVPPLNQGTERSLDTQKEGAGNTEEAVSRKNGEESQFYTKHYTCAFCGTGFPSLVVKSKNVRLVKTDSDFCPHYRTVNPLFYEVAVCPKCGYAFNEEMQKKLNDRERANLAKRLPEIRKPLRFDGVRNLSLAVESFRAAIACLEAVEGKRLLLGKLYLKVAWLYRTSGNEAEERGYTEKALWYLDEAYRTEHSADPSLELNLLYLLGDLSFRLGLDDAAARWFNKILTHPKRSANPGILNRTRDRWYDIRQKQKEKGKPPVEPLTPG
ncbi:MAG: DUF2225 domain-containing protein [Bacillota bacterium]